MRRSLFVVWLCGLGALPGCDDGSSAAAADAATDAASAADAGDSQQSMASGDTDGDGVRDRDDEFPTDPAESEDGDGDGVGDNGDAFPKDASESADTDDDGVGDNTDAFPSDPDETTDTDNDGVGDKTDAFPDDSSEQSDSDGDGRGDNADPDPDVYNPDSDGDGIDDADDPMPLDASRCGDSDADQCDDCSLGSRDPDNDGRDADDNGLCDQCDEATCSSHGACHKNVVGGIVCVCEPTYATDDCSVPECGRPEGPGNSCVRVVSCGANDSCSMIDDLCCLDGLDPDDASCEADVRSCSVGNAVQCDGAEDCPGALECCLELTAGAAVTVSCLEADACVTDADTLVASRVCHLDGDCADGELCEPALSFDWWGTCE
jgi:hypothetical protein